jgi:prevent-host-death family protein
MKRRARARAVLPVFRNRRGERVDAAAFTSTVAKNEFGRILEIALRGRVVVITKHDAPKAVLVSLDDFNALTGSVDMTLDTLSGEFDAMLTRMQGPKARAAMKAAYEASPKELGKAAVAAARKRG